MLPDPPGYGDDATDGWLALLDEAGALDALRSPASAPSVAAPAGGVAAWAQRVIDNRGRSWRRQGPAPRWNALLAELIDTVREDLLARGAELRLGVESSWSVDLDLLDLCLAAGVPVQNPALDDEDGELRFDLDDWFGTDAKDRRDLAAIAADARFLPALVRGLRDYLEAERGDGSAERRRKALRERATWKLDAAGLRTAAQAWLAAIPGRVGSAPTVLTLADTLDELAPLWTYDGLSLAPDVFAGLASADTADALARSLRAGLPAELGWPGHAAAAAEVGRSNDLAYWPYLVFGGKSRAVVLGPDGVVLDHTYRTPQGVKLDSYDSLSAGPFVDGQLRIDWSDGSYWSGRPTEALRGDHGWGTSWVTGCGGVPCREAVGPSAPVRCASATPRIPTTSSSSATASRTGVWMMVTTTSSSGASTTRRRAPGRRSLPAFLDVELAAGDSLHVRWSHLRPAPEAFAGSPLGWRDGLVGWRVIRHADGTFTGTGIDGRSVTWAPVDNDDEFVGAFQVPGDDRIRPATYADNTVTLWDVDGRQPAARWPIGPGLPAPTFWHALRPVDEAGSKALRGVDAALAGRLLAACAGAKPKGATGGGAQGRRRAARRDHGPEVGRGGRRVGDRGRAHPAGPAEPGRPAGRAPGSVRGAGDLARDRRGSDRGAAGDRIGADPGPQRPRRDRGSPPPHRHRHDGRAGRVGRGAADRRVGRGR
ncbi:hypothetical protein ACFQX7_30835 [Luedemannella flava]